MDKNLSDTTLNILITGGSGFLSGRLGEYLSKKGHNIFFGTRNINSLDRKEYKKFKIVETNFEVQDSLNKACKDIDLIIHAAGMNRSDSNDSISKAKKANLECTKKLFMAANKNKVSDFIFFSTVWVYRQPLQGFYNEDSCSDNDHFYASSNLAAEKYLQKVKNNSNINISIFRLSNVIGHPLVKESNCWGLVANSFCKDIIEKKCIVINSDGSAQRDLISMSSFCKTIYSFINCNKKNRILFNLSSESTLNIYDLALLIKKRSKKILNLDPKVIVKKTIKEGLSQPKLLISNKNLRDIGITPDKALNQDIDELLMFCYKNFKPKQP